SVVQASWMSSQCRRSAPHDNVSVLCFFFFSSRRRHTRLVSDWSSDVCSSDLASRCCADTPRSSSARGHGGCHDRTPDRGGQWPRSEERRVGKEGRSRWSPCH